MAIGAERRGERREGEERGGEQEGRGDEKKRKREKSVGERIAEVIQMPEQKGKGESGKQGERVTEETG